jgi:hypothetical protein
MSTINNIAATSIQPISLNQKKTSKKGENRPTKTIDIKQEDNSNLPNNKVTYKPDLEKVKTMKEETDRRLFELFKKSVNSNFTKQSNGLRGVLDKLLNGEEVSVELKLKLTPDNIEKAKQEVSDDGYWGPEATSDRFIEFAKALSGGDPEKISLLKDSFIKGYKAAEELWGGELPTVCKKTYDATLEKFDKWSEEEEI